MSLKTNVSLKLHTKTRWFDLPPPESVDKAAFKKKVFIDTFGRECWEDFAEPETDEVVLNKGLMILNDLPLTKIDKLSDMFIDTGIGRNRKCLEGAIELIVKKAQDEPHFAALCAELCLKVSRAQEEIVAGEGGEKTFKKMLLNKCQDEFEAAVIDRIKKAIEGVEDDEERYRKKELAKKRYLRYMRFIGELYNRKCINTKRIFMILPQLLEGNDENGTVDEEKVEIFSTLMTVIGLKLEQCCVDLRDIGEGVAFDKLEACWDTVKAFIGGKTKAAKAAAVSNRTKSMLQALLEMRNNGEYVPGTVLYSVLYCALNIVSFTLVHNTRHSV